jgi:hypothetical protein
VFYSLPALSGVLSSPYSDQFPSASSFLPQLSDILILFPDSLVSVTTLHLVDSSLSFTRDPQRVGNLPFLVTPERLDNLPFLVTPERLDNLPFLVTPERLDNLPFLVTPERLDNLKLLSLVTSK